MDKEQCYGNMKKIIKKNNRNLKSVWIKHCTMVI